MYSEGKKSVLKVFEFGPDRREQSSLNRRQQEFYKLLVHCRTSQKIRCRVSTVMLDLNLVSGCRDPEKAAVKKE